MKTTIKIQNDSVKLIAHRGLSGLERENTCRAFIAAGNRENYFGIETDVHRTIDGKYVTIHDGNTGRVSATDMEIATSTFDEIRNVILTDVDGDTTRADLRVPTLEEYITICKRYGKKAILELKCAFTKEQISEIISIIEEKEYLDQVIFISFVREALVLVRELLPTQPIQYLTGNFNEDVVEFMKKHNFDYDAHHSVITEESMKILKDAGISVNVWTVDSPERANELIDLGVEYITTNILE